MTHFVERRDLCLWSTVDQHSTVSSEVNLSADRYRVICARVDISSTFTCELPVNYCALWQLVECGVNYVTVSFKSI